MSWSEPISRILSPVGWRSSLCDGDCSSPLATYPETGASNPCAPETGAALLFGLALGGVYRAGPVTWAAGGLLHHPFTLTALVGGGLLSVALSVGSPRLDVIQHRAL